MSQETYLIALSASDREHYLQTNAAKCYEGKYMKPLSEDEIAAAKDLLTENCIKLGDLNEELSEIKKSFKEKMEPLQIQNKIVLTEIRSRQRTTEGFTYDMPNYPENMMETYNDAGELMSSRRLRPDEKQGNVFQLGLAQ